MQIIDDPYRNKSAALGAAFGKGLAEQLPKTMDRYRLSKELESLQNQKEPLNLQQVAKISSFSTPQQLSMLMPFIERQNQNQFIKQQAMGEQNQNIPSIRENVAQPKIEQKYKETETKQPEEQKFKSIINPETERLARNPALPKTQKQLSERAVQLVQENKARDLVQGLELAQIENEREMSSQKGIEQQYAKETQLRDQLYNEWDRKAKLVTDSMNQSDLNQEATGKFIEELYRKMEDKVAKGESVNDATNWGKEKYKKFADARLNLDKIGGKFLAKNSEKAYKNLQHAYEKENQLKTMVDDLVTSANLSRPKASEIAYPLSKNVNSVIKNTKPYKEYTTAFTPVDYDVERINRTDTLTEKLMKNLTAKDSLLAIGSHIKDLGYDAEEYLDHLRRMQANGMLNLTDDQSEELSSISDFNSSIGDIYMEYM